MITKDMVIGDVINAHPELVRTFFANGMMCIGCPASQAESLTEACMVHGTDVDAIVAKMNAFLASKSSVMLPIVRVVILSVPT